MTDRPTQSHHGVSNEQLRPLQKVARLQHFVSFIDYYDTIELHTNQLQPTTKKIERARAFHSDHLAFFSALLHFLFLNAVVLISLFLAFLFSFYFCVRFFSLAFGMHVDTALLAYQILLNHFYRNWFPPTSSVRSVGVFCIGGIIFTILRFLNEVANSAML